MRIVSLLAAAALSVTALTPALAAEGISRGASVVSADGKRLARIDRINTDGSDQPVSVSILYDGAFVYLPYSSLSEKDGKIVTSLSRDEVRKLRNDQR